ncbi:hypothetical protein FH972_026454 [Carpinus fangiana]|uniref:Uncharacterized protein n=1 Tax=Carpinus fangiana TaxID=176857 RepID=A0A5N6L408_9ROSI|nr:hypothetical protein FH972_026454 [Carpinus fangiana]
MASVWQVERGKEGKEAIELRRPLSRHKMDRAPTYSESKRNMKADPVMVHFSLVEQIAAWIPPASYARVILGCFKLRGQKWASPCTWRCSNQTECSCPVLVPKYVIA